MPKVKEMIPMLIPLILMFYFIYPQALEVNASSFVALAGIVGLGLYAYHRFPFKEVVTALSGLFVLFFIYYSLSWVNNVADGSTTGYFRTQIAWFFTAYLVVVSIFKAHKNPTFNTFLLYVVAAITLQSLITFLMYLNEGVHDFFFSLQMQGEYTEAIMEEAGSQRLMGYGIGFFGAGALSGMGLIAASYLLIRMRLSTKGFILLVACYVFMFYIGLFMARTTVVGMLVGLVLIAILYLKDNKSVKKQAKKFIIVSFFLMSGGYIFAIFYFSGFSTWAFELFTNLFEHGRLETKSSNGLEEMFVFPDDLHTILFGRGYTGFWGSDVGYSRLFFYVGVPGAILYFLYQFFIMKLCYTKDWGVNFFALTMVLYTMILNFKGWIDLNFILYGIFFFFMFYKYYVYYPKIYMKREFVLPKFKTTVKIIE
ncbi:MAG: hypothetical protein ACK5M3_05195 [Dysgonomonas sp.]